MSDFQLIQQRRQRSRHIEAASTIPDSQLPIPRTQYNTLTRSVPSIAAS